jgi:hypothetical protein
MVPVTVKKCVPCTTCTMVQQDCVKKVPYTVCRMETHTVCKKVPYTVCKMVPYTTKVKVPYTVNECVPVTVCKRVKVCTPEEVCVRRLRLEKCERPVNNACECGGGFRSFWERLCSKRLCCDTGCDSGAHGCK